MSRQGLKRSIKSNQVGLREINVIITGTGTPAATGYDQYRISQVIDNGVGNYTIVFNRPFVRGCQCKGLVMITDECIGKVSAVAYDRITVQIDDATDGTTPKDGSFYLSVIGSDHRFDY